MKTLHGTPGGRGGKDPASTRSDFRHGILALAVLGWGLAPAVEAADKDKLPSAFHQLLPRGRIASVDEPRFVSAEKADLPPDAWVLGVVIDGEARAYSLNLLNRHEIVNDRIGEETFAAVW